MGSAPEMSLAVLGGLGLLAGTLGALAGVGGGILIVPALTLWLGVPLPLAVGASLASVIATSSGASAQYVKKGLADLKLGIVLELATTVGAVSGAAAAAFIARPPLMGLLGAVLAWASFSLWRRGEKAPDGGRRSYRRYPAGLALSSFAGALSGLLGIGGGPIKVPLMHLVMGVPWRTASATSNFMIGVTASASAFLYWRRGDIDPWIAAPLVIGVLAGARLGAALMPKVPVPLLRRGFAALLAYLSVSCLFDAVKGLG